MKAFRYDRPATVAAAVTSLGAGAALLKANGIDVLDRMKERVDLPDRVVALVDVKGLDGIEEAAGTLKIGALATLASLAASPVVRAGAPALARAAGDAASPQLRERATLGGNLAQHTRCGYYRHASFPCWKRGAETCPVRAEGAVQEEAGIFGNDPCASAHPSNLAPVLGALAATVVVAGPGGERKIPLEGLYEAPKKGKASDTTLGPADVIVRVEVPKADANVRQGFYEVRRRARFDWALVLAATWVRVEGDKVTDARVWLGAVAPTPIAVPAAAKALVGAPASGAGFAAAVAASAKAAVVGATPLAGTKYKVDLVQVAVRRALLGDPAEAR